MKRYMNFQDIRRQQFAVATKTNEEMPGLFEPIDDGVSAIINILYEVAKIPDISTPIGKVQSAAWQWIYKSVFTIGASLTCAEFGFYAESLSLNRSLTETLVQVIYLKRHPAEIAKLPSLSSGTGRKLSFASMFKEIIPGYYEKYYSLSSEFTHPGWGSNAFKITRNDDGEGMIDQGVIYKSDRFTSTFNELVILILGFLRALAILFSPSDWTAETFQAWKDAITRLVGVVEGHIAFRGGANDWHRLTEPLWRGNEIKMEIS